MNKEILEIHNSIILKYNSIALAQAIFVLEQRIEDLQFIKDYSTNPLEQLECDRMIFIKHKDIEWLKKIDLDRFIRRVKKSMLENDYDTYTAIVRDEFDDRIEFSMNSQPKTRLTCEVCDCSVLPDDTECSNCGCQFDIVYKDTDFEVYDRIDMSRKTKYTSNGHLKEAIDIFMGVSPKMTIPDDLWGSLTGLRSKTDIMSVLKSKKEYKKIIKYINYIFHTITKTQAPDITCFIEQLYKLNDCFENEYRSDSCKSIRGLRKSSINVNYKLYLFLNKLGYKVGLDEFKMLKSVEKMKEAETIAKSIFKKLDWRWI